MKIQFASDLHLDSLQRGFPGERLIKPLPEADLLILAGDISSGTWVMEAFSDWPVPVIYVAGNHEYYGLDLPKARMAMQEAARGTSIRFLDLETFEYMGTRFLGCTLWTDYRLWPDWDQEELMAVAANGMPDHRHIQFKGESFMPGHALQLHIEARRWLEEELARPYSGKTVVVTHHGPHRNSVHGRYSGNPMSAAFVSDLDSFLELADVWIHGHVHDNFDYRHKRCRVCANPRGYALNMGRAARVQDLRFENSSFQENAVIDLEHPASILLPKKPGGQDGLFRSFFESFEEAMIVLSGSTVMDVNPAGLRLLGWEHGIPDQAALQEALLDRTVAGFGSKSTFLSLVQECKKGVIPHFPWRLSIHGEPADFTIRVVPCGEEEALDLLRLTVKPPPSTEGKWMEERKELQGLLDLLRSKLENKNCILENLLENFPGGVSMMDGSLKFLAWNKEMIRVCDLPEAMFELEEPPTLVDMFKFNLARGEYGNVDPEAYLQFRVEQALRFEPHVFERVRPDGTVLEIRGAPISNGGFVTTYQDVTSNYRLREDLKTSIKLAKEATTAKSTFLANMSHELRTPLNAILLYSELVLEDAETQGLGSISEDIQKIRGATRHLLNLIDGILDLSKIEAGKMTVFCEDIDLEHFIAEVVATVSPLIKANHNRLEVKIGPGLKTLYTDATKLRQSLYNLLNNASKFTKGGIITLSIASLQDQMQFEIKDTGIGMTEEQLKRVFQEFTQADESTTRNYGGTGLGLTISKKLCRLLGGDITVSSKPMVGSTFTIYLPILPKP